MRKYRLGFIGKDVTVFRIGEPNEWEVSPSSGTQSVHFKARDNEEAMQWAGAYLRGYEEGSQTHGREGEMFFQSVVSAVLRPVFQDNKEGDDLSFQHQSLFEEMKDEIRQNLRAARDRDLERLYKQKEEIEKKIAAQEAYPIPLFIKEMNDKNEKARKEILQKMGSA